MEVSKVFFPREWKDDVTGIKHSHSIEVGTSSWDNRQLSIRNRYDQDDRFMPHNSSEVPRDDLLNLFLVALDSHMFSVEELFRMQAALTSVIVSESDLPLRCSVPNNQENQK